MEKLKLWTIQDKAAYDKFQKTGVLRADSNFAMFDYSWMAKQMIARIGPPPTGVTEPVWAWHSWEGECKPSITEDDIKNSRVVIEFTIDSDKVLLSDFDAWHAVLMFDYLALTAEEYADFEDQVYYSDYTWDDIIHSGNSDDNLKALQDKLSESWVRIFDIKSNHIFREPDIGASIQATFWELRIDQVTKVTFLGGN